MLDFAALCDDNPFDGYVLSEIYALACRRGARFPVDFLELRDSILKVHIEAKNLLYVFMRLEELGFLSFQEEPSNLLEDDMGELHIGGGYCTFRFYAIERNLYNLQEEKNKVKAHNKRALELDLPATLTLEEWINNLRLFGWSCAYCMGKYEVLEHIVPLTFPDSGTTAMNCVPACTACNALKGPWHPDRMPTRRRKKIRMDIQDVLDKLRSIKPNKVKAPERDQESGSYQDFLDWVAARSERTHEDPSVRRPELPHDSGNNIRQELFYLVGKIKARRV